MSISSSRNKSGRPRWRRFPPFVISQRARLFPDDRAADERRYLVGEVQDLPLFVAVVEEHLLAVAVDHVEEVKVPGVRVFGLADAEVFDPAEMRHQAAGSNRSEEHTSELQSHSF